MKIILIGNNGQVGREVQELAQNKGYNVVGFDLNNLDIISDDQINTAFAQHSDANIVINAAAYTAVDKAEDEAEKAYAVNCDGVRNLAQACRQCNIPLIHLSTDYVFDGTISGAYQEIDQTNPLGVYGKSKLAGEKVLAKSWEKHVVLRVSWVFGRYGNNFVKTILRLAQEKEELNVVGDQRGCPTAALDIARVLLELAEGIKNDKHWWGIYHYCGAPVTTWYKFAEKIIEIARQQRPLKIQQLNQITTAQYPTRATRPHNSELLTEKITRDYGIERHEWLDYLQNVVEQIFILQQSATLF